MANFKVLIRVLLAFSFVVSNSQAGEINLIEESYLMLALKVFDTAILSQKYIDEEKKYQRELTLRTRQRDYSVYFNDETGTFTLYFSYQSPALPPCSMKIEVEGKADARGTRPHAVKSIYTACAVR